MKPPFPYFGGKQTLAPTIADLLPAHGHYVEPYGGSLALLLAKQPSPQETVNDLNQDLMTFWRVLRDRPADLERVCALTPHSRMEREIARELDTADDLERARRVFVQLTQGRAGGNGTGWRHDVSVAHTSMPNRLRGYVDRFAPAAARLARVTLEARPALELVRAYGSSSDVLLYVDPPYLGSTRQAGGGGYAQEMKGEPDHRELAAVLHACSATVVLSGYASPLYDELYDGWHRHTFAAATTQGGVWANRTEVLWSNRPLAMQDALFGGVA